MQHGHAGLLLSRISPAPSSANVHQRFSTLVLCKATDEELTSVEAPVVETPADVATISEVSATPAAAGSALFDGFPFSKGQEVINARAAMAGFVAAVVSELVTQKSVWVQIAGRYSDGDLVQRATGTSALLFGAIVALLSYATLAPFFLKGETNTSRSFGPFTPSRERDVGRVAMIGFALLLAVETARGNTPLF